MEFEYKPQPSTMFLSECVADGFLYDGQIYILIANCENLTDFDEDRELACINLSNQSVEFFSREVQVAPVEFSLTYTPLIPKDKNEMS